MYLFDDFNRMGGEPAPRHEPSRYSKGYPEKPAETPRGILSDNLSQVSLRRLRQIYGPANPRP